MDILNCIIRLWKLKRVKNQNIEMICDVKKSLEGGRDENLQRWQGRVGSTADEA